MGGTVLPAGDAGLGSPRGVAHFLVPPASTGIGAWQAPLVAMRNSNVVHNSHSGVLGGGDGSIGSAWAAPSPGPPAPSVEYIQHYHKPDLFLPFGPVVGITPKEISQAPSSFVIPSGTAVLDSGGDFAGRAWSLANALVESEDARLGVRGSTAAEAFTSLRSDNSQKPVPGRSSGLSVAQRLAAHEKLARERAELMDLIRAASRSSQPPREERVVNLETVLRARLESAGAAMYAALDAMRGVRDLDSPLDLVLQQAMFFLPLPSPLLADMAAHRAATTAAKGVGGEEAVQAAHAAAAAVSARAALAPYDVFLSNLLETAPFVDVISLGLRSWSKPGVAGGACGNTSGAGRSYSPTGGGGGKNAARNKVIRAIADDELPAVVAAALAGGGAVGGKARALVAERTAAANLAAVPFLKALRSWGFTRVGHVVRIPLSELLPALSSVAAALRDPGSDATTSAAIDVANALPPAGVGMLIISVLEGWLRTRPEVRAEAARNAGAFDARYQRGPTDPRRAGATRSQKEIFIAAAMIEAKRTLSAGDGSGGASEVRSRALDAMAPKATQAHFAKAGAAAGNVGRARPGGVGVRESTSNNLARSNLAWNAADALAESIAADDAAWEAAGGAPGVLVAPPSGLLAAAIADDVAAELAGDAAARVTELHHWMAVAAEAEASSLKYHNAKRTGGHAPPTFDPRLANFVPHKTTPRELDAIEKAARAPHLGSEFSIPRRAPPPSPMARH